MVNMRVESLMLLKVNLFASLVISVEIYDGVRFAAINYHINPALHHRLHQCFRTFAALLDKLNVANRHQRPVLAPVRISFDARSAARAATAQYAP